MKINKKILSLVVFILVGIVMISCSDISSSTTNTTSIVTTNTTVTTVSSLQTTTESNNFSSSTESVILPTGIALIKNNQKFYIINQNFNISSLELVVLLSDGSDEIINNEDIKVRSFDSSTSGKKTIFIIYEKFMLETDVYVLEDYAFEIEMEYYEDAINLKGVLLQQALRTIINDGFINLLYGEARYILPESDVDPNNSNNVILVYLGTSVSNNWDRGVTWNREHVWPQSRLGVYADPYNDFPSKATDLHNLKPADPDENANRSNDYFDWFKTSSTYEPRDEVKGDIARIILYMTTMYYDLTLNDNPNADSRDMTMGILSVLLEWNELDPVDDFERNRNEVIYSYQNNRNPFIDYPEFVELIWGDSAE